MKTPEQILRVSIVLETITNLLKIHEIFLAKKQINNLEFLIQENMIIEDCFFKIDREIVLNLIYNNLNNNGITDKERVDELEELIFLDVYLIKNDYYIY